MTTQEPVRELEAGLPLRLLAGLAALLILLFTITTVPGFRSDDSFDTGYDGWLQGTAYVAIAALAVVRPLSVRRDRLVWGLFGLSVCLRALGFVVYLGYVRRQEPQPYPSIADYCWLAMDGVLLLALWILLRRRLRKRSIDIGLAAVQMGVTVAGVAVALLFSTLDTISGADLPDDGGRHQPGLPPARHRDARARLERPGRHRLPVVVHPDPDARHHRLRSRRRGLRLPGDRGDLPPRDTAGGPLAGRDVCDRRLRVATRRRSPHPPDVRVLAGQPGRRSSG